MFYLNGPKNIESIDMMLGVIKNISNNLKPMFPDIKPLVAGGVLRDRFFNLNPKDIDIFIDLSNTGIENDEELDDYMYLYLSHFMEELDKEVGEPEEDIERFRNLGDDYGTFINMKVFEIETDKVIEFENDDDRAYSFVPIQIIFNKNNYKEPNFVTKDFDHSLVKCFYDPETDKITYEKEFLDSVKNKTIENYRQNDQKTAIRLINLHRRLKNFIGIAYKIK